MDVLRGIAVLLVVLFHAIAIAAQESNHEFVRLEQVVNTISPLRMPMMFFLSGLLVPRSLAKGARTYISGKVRRVLYPYLLWSILMLLAFEVAASTIEWSSNASLLDIITDPFEHLWFLAYLFLYYMLALASRWVPATALAFAALIISSFPIEGWDDWTVFWARAVPFFIGMAIAQSTPSTLSLIKNRWVCATIFLTFLGTMYATVLGLTKIPQTAWSFPLVILAILSLAGLIAPIASTPLMRPLRFAGISSIQIYILHWPFLIFTLRALGREGYSSPWGMLAIGLTVGIVPAVVVALLSARFRAIEWLFVWNPPPRRPGRTATRLPEQSAPSRAMT